MANHQKTEDEVRQFLDDVFMAIDAGRCTINIQPWSGNKVNKTRLYMTEKNLHLKDVCDVVKRLTVKNYSATKDDVNPNFHDELVWEFGIREIIVDTAGCTLYVTMEPCPMCAGAILGARISKVVYGVKDPAKGALGSVVDLTSYPLGGKPEVIGGCREGDCRELLRRFFEGRRSGGNGSDKSPSDEDRSKGNVSATDVTE